MGNFNTGDRSSFIDFHSDDTNTDFGARIIRSAGINGTFKLDMKGTGDMIFEHNAVDAIVIDSNADTTIKNELTVEGTLGAVDINATGAITG